MLDVIHLATLALSAVTCGLVWGAIAGVVAGLDG